MGNGAQFITAPLCHSFPLTFFLCFSVGPPLAYSPSRTGPAWVLSMGPFLVESLLLSIGCSPTRSLLQQGHSMGCSFLQGMSTCCGMGFSIGCTVDICFSVVLSPHCMVDNCSAPGRSPPLLLLSTFIFTGLPHSHPSTSSCCIAYFPFLNTFSPRLHQLGWSAQLWPAVGPFWGWLELTLFNTGATPDLFPQKPALHQHHCQDLATCIQ